MVKSLIDNPSRSNRQWSLIGSLAIRLLEIG